MGELLGLGRRPTVPETIAGMRQESIRPMTTMELWEMQAQQAYASRDPWKRMDMVPDMGPVAGVVKKANLVDRAGPMVQKAGSGEPYKRMPQSRQGEVSPTSVTPFELQQLGLSKGAEPWDMGSKTTLGPATRRKK